MVGGNIKIVNFATRSGFLSTVTITITVGWALPIETMMEVKR